MFETEVVCFRGAHYVVDTFSQVGVLRRFEGQLNSFKWNHVFLNTHDRSPSQGFLMTVFIRGHLPCVV